MCTIAAALGGLSSAANYMGQVAAADAANAASKQNAINANVAAGWKYSDLGARFIYNSKGLQREAGKAVMDSRAAVATGIASAGDAGVTGPSLGSLVAATKQQGAENAFVAESKRDDLKMGLITDLKSTEAEAANRIASMPPQSPPSLLGLAIGFADAVGRGGQSQGWWNGGYNTTGT